MTRRHGDEIRAALCRLGCDVYEEDDTNYYVARANVRTQSVRKWYIAAEQERRIVERLGYTMVQYMDAVRAIKVESTSRPQEAAVQEVAAQQVAARERPKRDTGPDLIG